MDTMDTPSTTTDPFLQVQADVLTTLNSIRPLFSSYLRIRSLAKSPQNPELQQARSELESTLSDLTADLDDLVESVRAIELDPYRYGLELEEVARRRELVDEVGDEVERMRGELKRTIQIASTTTGAGAGAAGTGPGGGHNLPNPAEFDHVLPSGRRTKDTEGVGGGIPDEDAFHNDEEGDDDYYAEMEQQRQVELMHEQDEQLDGVFRTVGTLRRQADDMGRELEDQAGMLEDVDTLADRVGGKLQGGVNRLKHIVRKNEDTMSSFCIGVLIFVLILLLILVLVL